MPMIGVALSIPKAYPSRMTSSGAAIAALKERAAEYAKIISSFERLNADLRLRRVTASTQTKEFCDRHIELNARTLVMMRHGLDAVNQQINTATPFPEKKERTPPARP